MSVIQTVALRGDDATGAFGLPRPSVMITPNMMRAAYLKWRECNASYGAVRPHLRRT